MLAAPEATQTTDPLPRAKHISRNDIAEPKRRRQIDRDDGVPGRIVRVYGGFEGKYPRRVRQHIYGRSLTADTFDRGVHRRSVGEVAFDRQRLTTGAGGDLGCALFQVGPTPVEHHYSILARYPGESIGGRPPMPPAPH